MQFEIGDIIEYRRYLDNWGTGRIIGKDCWDSYSPPTWLIRQEKGGLIRRRDVRPPNTARTGQERVTSPEPALSNPAHSPAQGG